MKQRIYIDTSVIGGYYDAEFSEYTKPLFRQIHNSELRIMHSEVTERELINAPEKVKELIRQLKASAVGIFVICASFTGSFQNGTQCVPNYHGPITACCSKLKERMPGFFI